MASYFSNFKKRFRLKHYINYFVVIAVLIVLIALQLTGGLRRSSANLFAQIGFSVILAVSLNLVVGFLGELSLGHAGFMCVGAYFGSYLSSALSGIMSPTLALIISMLLGGVIAAGFGFVVGLPALRLKGDYLAIVTLAFGEIVRNIFKNLPWFGGALGLATKPYGTKLYIVAFCVVLVMLFLIQNLIRSKHGRAITAIRDNEIAAKAMGINVTFYKLLVFVVAAFFAGVAGVIYGHYTTPILYSFFSYNYSIEILVMVVLGGMANISGTIASATLITVLNFILTTKLSGDLAALKYLVYSLILMIVVIFGNAPSLLPIKEKLSLSNQIKKLCRKTIKKAKKEGETVRDDTFSWHQIPTKIQMDEVLSADISASSGVGKEKPDRSPDDQK